MQLQELKALVDANHESYLLKVGLIAKMGVDVSPENSQVNDDDDGMWMR